MNKKYYVEVYEDNQNIGLLQQSSVYYHKITWTNKLEDARAFDDESRAKSTANLVEMLSGKKYKGKVVYM